MSLFANAHDLAHHREVEELRREIGTLRHELEVTRAQRDAFMEDSDSFLQQRNRARALIVAWWHDPDNPPTGVVAIVEASR